MLAGWKTLNTQKNSSAIDLSEEEEKKAWIPIKETAREIKL